MTAELYDQLAQAHRDIALYRNLLALLPYAVHVDREAERVEFARRDAQRRAAALARIPAQRRPVEATVPRGIRLPQRSRP